MKIQTLIDIILYGDIYETPLDVLGGRFSPDRTKDMDREQPTRLSLATTLKAEFSTLPTMITR